MTLQCGIQFAVNGVQAAFVVQGNCLEALNVNDGDYVVIDPNKMPRPRKRDICLCYARYPGRKDPEMFVKEYIGKWGPWQQVGTAYKGRTNCGFHALHIFGVACACYDSNGKLKWEKDVSDYPADLPKESTIHGVGISDPASVLV